METGRTWDMTELRFCPNRESSRWRFRGASWCAQGGGDGPAKHPFARLSGARAVQRQAAAVFVAAQAEEHGGDSARPAVMHG